MKTQIREWFRCLIYGHSPQKYPIFMKDNKGGYIGIESRCFYCGKKLKP